MTAEREARRADATRVWLEPHNPDWARMAEAEAGRRGDVEALGYLWRGEFGIPERRHCVLEPDGKRVFHTHFFVDGHDNVVRQLLFRDYLRAHREEALAYEAIKRAAAAAHPRNSMAYNDHKSAWILACQARAEAWASRMGV